MPTDNPQDSSFSADPIHDREPNRNPEIGSRELATLLEISREVTSNLSVDSLLHEILEKLRQVVDFTNASIMRLEGEIFINLVDFRKRFDDSAARTRFTANNLIDRKVLQTRKPLIIKDIKTERSEAADELRRLAPEAMDTFYKDVCSWMRLPMIARGDVIGMLTLHHNEPDHYSERDSELAMIFAGHAAIAIDNASLFYSHQKRSAELSSLLNAARTVSSTLELEKLLTVLLGQLREVVEFDLGSVLIIEGEDLVLAAVFGIGLPPLGTRYPLARYGNTRRMLEEGRLQFVSDVNADEALARQVRQDLDSQGLENLNSWMGVPLIARNRSIGMLSLAHTEPGFYTGVRVDLVNTFSLQAAIAIENARLYRRARELAAIEERQRLARELHDSVSQALYGIVLGARTARALLDRNPEQVHEPLEYIASLAEAGLAEMRALIFELRPESLREEGLVAAITKQADSLRARHQLVVRVKTCTEPDVSLDIKESFYRISQEALHNIIKHARAHEVQIELADDDGALVLEVVDDGIGFDAGGEFPGHLGLKSMRERIQGLGGDFELQSDPGRGTRLRVRVRTG